MKMKVVTGDLCWVANLLFQLHTAPTLSSSSSQFVLFSFFSLTNILVPDLKKVQCMPAKWPDHFFFLKVQIQREVGNREKRSDHGSQNREVQLRFARVSFFFFP